MIGKKFNMIEKVTQNNLESSLSILDHGNFQLILSTLSINGIKIVPKDIPEGFSAIFNLRFGFNNTFKLINSEITNINVILLGIGGYNLDIGNNKFILANSQVMFVISEENCQISDPVLQNSFIDNVFEKTDPNILYEIELISNANFLIKGNVFPPG